MSGKTLIYEGEVWEFQKPARPSTPDEERAMLRHKHRTDCTGKAIAELRNAGMLSLFSKLVCETCLKEI